MRVSEPMAHAPELTLDSISLAGEKFEFYNFFFFLFLLLSIKTFLNELTHRNNFISIFDRYFVFLCEFKNYN